MTVLELFFIFYTYRELILPHVRGKTYSVTVGKKRDGEIKSRSGGLEIMTKILKKKRFKLKQG